MLSLNLNYNPHFLAHNIQYGSPIGNPPPLSKIFLPKKIPSANLHLKIIDAELMAKVVTGALSL